MTRMSYLEAGKQGLAEAMAADPNVWAVGEDLGRGGVFGQYRGLVERFGPERIVDAPISEAWARRSARRFAAPGRWSRCGIPTSRSAPSTS